MRSWSCMMAVLACTGALWLGACGDSGNKAASAGGGGGAAAAGDVLIAIIAKSNSNPVFQAAHQGAKDAAAELTTSTGKHIKVQILTPPDEDATKQADAIESAVRMGAQGIAISCSNAGTVTSPINDAVDKGVVVMCFDSDAPASKRLCYYGTDDITGGKLVMQYLAQEMGDKGTMAIIAGSEAAPNLRKRVDGVHEELKNHPGITEIKSGPVHHKEVAADAAQALQDTQRANPEITGWALIGGWPLFTSNALPWKPGEVKVVSFDALPEEISYLQDGHVNVLLAQDCYGWGHKSVEILVDKIVNKKDPPSTLIIDPLTKVTKENADEWSKKWDKWKNPTN